jgi:ketosteroid isomerase-like protein
VWCGDEASHRAPFDAVSEVALRSRATEVVSVANSWAAELGGDTVSLKEILADDFVGVGPRGFSLTREQWIARHEAENLKYGSFGLDEAEVHTYGDAAIVVCRQTAAGVYGDENGRYEIDERFRATLVFIRQRGDWHLAGLQLSPILGRP